MKTSAAFSLLLSTLVAASPAPIPQGPGAQPSTFFTYLRYPIDSDDRAPVTALVTDRILLPRSPCQDGWVPLVEDINAQDPPAVSAKFIVSPDADAPEGQPFIVEEYAFNVPNFGAWVIRDFVAREVNGGRAIECRPIENIQFFPTPQTCFGEDTLFHVHRHLQCVLD